MIGSVKFILPLAFASLASVMVAQKPHSAAKQKTVSNDNEQSKTWIYHETKDPMTDAVTHTLFLYGTPLTMSNGLDKPPALFFTCDPQTPRKINIGMGVMLDDPQPSFRFDKEPPENQHWFSGDVTATSFYKDDSLEGSEIVKLSRQMKVPTDELGADVFVKRMSEHDTLLVKATPRDGAPKIVSFDLRGLAPLLLAHCPVRQ